MNGCEHEDYWFDRTLCGYCNDMHYYCEDCGERLDYCEGEALWAR